MRLEGTCKIRSILGVEYQFGEFSVDNGYLVFEQNYSFGGKKRKVFPLRRMDITNIKTNACGDQLTFSCDNLEFELDGSLEGDVDKFATQIKAGIALVKQAKNHLFH